MGVRNRNHTKKGSSRMVYDIGLPNSDHAINLPKLERGGLGQGGTTQFLDPYGSNSTNTKNYG